MIDFGLEVKQPQVEFARFCGPDFLNLYNESGGSQFEAHTDPRVRTEELEAVAKLAYRLYEAIVGGPKSHLQSIVICAGTNVRTQALYKQFIDLVFKSPWFNFFHRYLEEQEQSDGVTRYKFNDKYIHYINLNLFVYGYADSSRATKLRGHTYAAALLDTREFSDYGDYYSTLLLGLRTTQGELICL